MAIFFSEKRIYCYSLALFAIVFLGLNINKAQAQSSIHQEGEFGIGLGAAHYFGDLNTRSYVNKPRQAATIFFRKNFGNYIAARIGVSYARLVYADSFNTNNEYKYRRNLDFKTNIWEATLQGDFNFFRFMPGEPEYNFTPYVTLGAGIFAYDPFTKYQGKKIMLRPLGTEGQGSTQYPERKSYKSMAFNFPIGVGIKYAINETMNIGFEVLHRVTTTDYIDDVSTTYVDPSVFPANPDGSPGLGYVLSDRSGEVGPPIGISGRQRGNSKQKDQYITAMLHLTINLQSYKCPTVN